MQTRSADEPMTTFVFCMDCGNRWKVGILQIQVISSKTQHFSNHTTRCLCNFTILEQNFTLSYFNLIFTQLLNIAKYFLCCCPVSSVNSNDSGMILWGFDYLFCLCCCPVSSINSNDSGMILWGFDYLFCLCCCPVSSVRARVAQWVR